MPRQCLPRRPPPPAARLPCQQLTCSAQVRAAFIRSYTYWCSRSSTNSDSLPYRMPQCFSCWPSCAGAAAAAACCWASPAAAEGTRGTRGRQLTKSDSSSSSSANEEGCGAGRQVKAEEVRQGRGASRHTSLSIKSPEPREYHHVCDSSCCCRSLSTPCHTAKPHRPASHPQGPPSYPPTHTVQAPQAPQASRPPRVS
jgi:hypothetical protein